MRALLFAVALGLAPAALAQPTATFADGVLTITGTDGDDLAILACVEGAAQLNNADIEGVACTDVLQVRFDLKGGGNSTVFRNVKAFALDPSTPSIYERAGTRDALELDLSAYTEDLRVAISPPEGLGGIGTASSLSESHIITVRDRFGVEVVSFYANYASGDDLQSFGVNISLGSGDDWFEIDPGLPAAPGGVTVYGGPGDDTMDMSDLQAEIFAGLEVFFNGQEGDDTFFSPTGRDDVVVTMGWVSGGETDRFTPGPGPDAVTIFGSGTAPLTIHEISGTLGTGCSFFDFTGGGGVLIEGDERVEGARYFMPSPDGGDVFAEAGCSGIERDLRWGNGGPDWFRPRGAAGGGTLVDIDFPEGRAEIFSDGFESGDLSWWAGTSPRPADEARRAEGDILWDGIDYQDWPSFADPSTSGPSTVLVRGKPDFPVTLDLGPDVGTGEALDELLVDPLGLPFTDDGTEVVIDGGPPITYAGVDRVTIGTLPTAVDDGPGDDVRLTVAPNPTGGHAAVRLAGAAGPVRVAVFDLLGREVAVLWDGPGGPGAWALPVERLAAGAYVVRARGEGWAQSQVVAVGR